MHEQLYDPLTVNIYHDDDDDDDDDSYTVILSKVALTALSLIESRS